MDSIFDLSEEHAFHEVAHVESCGSSFMLVVSMHNLELGCSGCQDQGAWINRAGEHMVWFNAVVVSRADHYAKVAMEATFKWSLHG